ncbi:MAG: class I SAM-dependent methyltransferase [Candidatus Andersenbacteria bacterium]|nr:class I SAM-dependent methyltransferase [Candidatus Andersenbacteria bacterium]
MSAVSRLERWWLDAWPHRWHVRRFVPRLLRSCPEPFRGEVLEVGSGSGWTSRRILETFPQVELTAVDVDARAQQWFVPLQERFGRRLRFIQADALALPFDRASFDVVLAIHVLHHVADPRAAVRQFLRVLRPGGLIGLGGSQPPRAAVESLVSEEGGSVVMSRGRRLYQLWARKPYAEGENIVYT